MKKFNERPGTVSNQYLHDLYRFFKLSVRRHEFRDIFKEKLDLHHIPALNNVLYNEYILFPIADFYLKKERWNEAIEGNGNDRSTERKRCGILSETGICSAKKQEVCRSHRCLSESRYIETG